MPIPVSNNQREFVSEALKQGLRVDGRALHAIRHPSVIFGFNPGHCEVSLGNTRVLAVVACDLVEPRPERSNDGFLTFNVDLSPMADVEYLHLTRLSEENATISRLIDRTLRGSFAIDTEALCILAGKCVWSIRVDITVLNNDGNLIDACYLAALLSLLNFRRPVVSIDGDHVKVHSLEAREPVPLSVHHVPVCVTFAVFDNGNILVADPTFEEEQLMSGRVVVAMNAHNEICLMDFPGGVPVAIRQLRSIPLLAADKVKVLTDFIDRSLQGDVQRRKHDALPLYAKTFYEKKRRMEAEAQAARSAEAGSDGKAVPSLSVTSQDSIEDSGFDVNDPFADFVSRMATAVPAVQEDKTEGGHKPPISQTQQQLAGGGDNNDDDGMAVDSDEASDDEDHDKETTEGSAPVSQTTGSAIAEAFLTPSSSSFAVVSKTAGSTSEAKSCRTTTITAKAELDFMVEDDSAGEADEPGEKGDDGEAHIELGNGVCEDVSANSRLAKKGRKPKSKSKGAIDKHPSDVGMTIKSEPTTKPRTKKRKKPLKPTSGLCQAEQD